ncbi:D-alanyl-D-alanine carboxypeptidase family protein [Microbulbifer pacificus]|uniref:D-alanyl-D-alanine carboxypeptidase family protein n=1 Tax=Microbulbifer pacificus TaxID=407164 RepID=UPI00131A0F67|nr:serine hydrolase [Microbulbifer pacificus]
MNTSSPTHPIDLTAKSAICVLLSKGADKPFLSIYEKHADLAITPASITKLLTALTAIKIASENKIPTSYNLTVSHSDNAGGSGRNLVPGDKISFLDGIANLLLTSSNITANVIAREFGSILQVMNPKTLLNPVNRFVEEMNSVSNHLQMKHSKFFNPHGLDTKGQRSTARDISVLTAICLKQRLINDTWGKEQKIINISGPNKRKLVARSIFRESTARVIPDFSIPQFLGGKSGTLYPSLFNLAAVSEINPDDNIISVIIGSPSPTDRYSDYLKLVQLANSILRP